MATRLEKAKSRFTSAYEEMEKCRIELENAKAAEKVEDWGTVSLRTVLDLAEVSLDQFDQDNYPRARDYMTGLITSLKLLRTKK